MKNVLGLICALICVLSKGAYFGFFTFKAIELLFTTGLFSFLGSILIAWLFYPIVEMMFPDGLHALNFYYLIIFTF